MILECQEYYSELLYFDGHIQSIYCLILLYYRSWMKEPEVARAVLHTQYHEVEKFVSALNIKW